MTPIEQFEDWAAICETKARYCRFLDTKRWEDWASIFTEDLVLDTTAAGGPITVGREVSIAAVRSVIETARTAHQVHTPEIALDGDRAEVIWAMQDRVVFDDGTGLVGYGHYHETYVKQDGVWKIAKSSLTRLHIDPLAGPGAS